MEASTTNALISAGGNLAGGLIGMVGQRKREKRAMDNQKQLMDIQARNQKQLNQHGHDLQKDMWDYTNFGNQMEHIKNAGLSAGLIYGGSGAGGSTTGSQGGGAASGGNAPAPQQMPMDIMAGGQALLTAANLELMKANTNKANAEADDIRGVEGTKGATQIAEGQSRISKLIAETSNEEAKNKLIKLEGEMKELDRLWYDREIFAKINKMEMDLYLAQGETWIQENSKQAIVDEIKAKATGQVIINDLNSSRIRLNEAQENQIRESIAQKWNEISLYDTEVNIKIAQTIINGLGTAAGILQAGKLAEAMKEAKGKVTSKTTQWQGTDTKGTTTTEYGK